MTLQTNRPLIIANQARFGITIGHDDTCDFVCSGVDDQIAINDALQKLSDDGGGEVNIKRGVYNLTDNIQVPDFNNIVIKGEGVGSTVFKGAGIEKNNNTEVNNFILKNIEIDLDSKPFVGLNLVSGVNNCLLDNIFIHDSASNFLLHWGTTNNLRVYNSKFLDAGKVTGADNCAGSQSLSYNGTAIFRDCHIEQSDCAGSALVTTGQTGNLTVTDCDLISETGVAYAGISIENQTGDSTGKLIAKYNRLKNCGIGTGVSANTNRLAEAYIKNNVIHGGSFPNGDRGGINANKTVYAEIQGNTMHNSSIGVLAYENDISNIRFNNIYGSNNGNASFWQDKGGIYSRPFVESDIFKNTVRNTNGFTPFGARLIDANGGAGGAKFYLQNNTLDDIYVHGAVLHGNQLSELKRANNEFSTNVSNSVVSGGLVSYNNIGVEL